MDKNDSFGITRRAALWLVAAGATAAVLPFKTLSAPRDALFVFDLRHRSVGSLLLQARRAGVPVVAVAGDITHLWRFRLTPRVPDALMGVTRADTLFGLHLLSRRLELRLVRSIALNEAEEPDWRALVNAARNAAEYTRSTPPRLADPAYFSWVMTRRNIRG